MPQAAALAPAALGAFASAAPSFLSSVLPSLAASAGLPGLGQLLMGGAGPGIGAMLSQAGTSGLAPALNIASDIGGATLTPVGAAGSGIPGLGSALGDALPGLGKSMLTGTGNNLMQAMLSKQPGSPTVNQFQAPQSPQNASMAPPIQFGNLSRNLGEMKPMDFYQSLFQGQGNTKGMMM